MIRFEAARGDIKKADIAGSLTEISADVFIMLKVIHDCINGRSKKAGKEFKLAILSGLADDEIRGKIFNDDSVAPSKGFTVAVDVNELKKQVKADEGK